jgi:hypothetical protein
MSKNKLARAFYAAGLAIGLHEIGKLTSQVLVLGADPLKPATTQTISKANIGPPIGTRRSHQKARVKYGHRGPLIKIWKPNHATQGTATTR